ncbi:MAG: type II secretion system F family protein [Candidatus Cloacimonadota bacterium]|nr:type II secretion system F family protein [Candidatus Cloacimonadota bacterium]
MLRDYRYFGETKSKQRTTGIIQAESKKEAIRKMDILAHKHNFTIKKYEKKRDWIYYVKFPNGKKLKGYQAAFNKEELQNVLEKMDYEITKIEPVLLDIKLKPPFEKIMMFIQMSAFMLKEKMSYDKILQMLAEEEDNRTLKDALKNIQSELKKGKEGEKVFGRYGHVFGKFPAYMLGLATKSGNMAEIYEATAKFMEREMEYRKSLRQALMSPAFIVFATILAILYYVMSIFPKTATLFVDLGIDIPPMTAGTLRLSEWLGSNWIPLVLIHILPIIGVVIYFKTDKGRFMRDKILIRLPVIGHLLHKTSIEIFFRVFSAIYSGSENNIETLKASASSCKNYYMEKQIKEVTIPLMLKEGASLIPALGKADVFNRTTLSRLRSGAETGNILSSAQQISKFYEKETTYKMENLIQSIQGWIGAFIGIVITAITIVSAEIATVQPPTPGL